MGTFEEIPSILDCLACIVLHFVSLVLRLCLHCIEKAPECDLYEEGVGGGCNVSGFRDSIVSWALVNRGGTLITRTRMFFYVYTSCTCVNLDYLKEHTMYACIQEHKGISKAKLHP